MNTAIATRLATRFLFREIRIARVLSVTTEKQHLEATLGSKTERLSGNC